MCWDPLPGAPFRLSLGFVATLGIRLGSGSGLSSADSFAVWWFWKMFSNLAPEGVRYRRTIRIWSRPRKYIKAIRNRQIANSIESVSIHCQVGIFQRNGYILGTPLEHRSRCLAQRVSQNSIFMSPILKPRNHEPHLSLLLVNAGAVIKDVPYALWWIGRNTSSLGKDNPCSDE